MFSKIKQNCETGAALPEGADAVVMVEQTELVDVAEESGEERKIRVLSSVKPGQDLRPIGSDIQQGELVLKKGVTIGPPEFGLLAMIGVSQVLV